MGNAGIELTNFFDQRVYEDLKFLLGFQKAGFVGIEPISVIIRLEVLEKLEGLFAYSHDC